MDDDFNAIMTIEEASRYLRIPKSTLYKLAQRRRLPSQKIGRHWRFRKDALDRWLEQGGADTHGVTSEEH